MYGHSTRARLSWIAVLLIAPGCAFLQRGEEAYQIAQRLSSEDRQQSLAHYERAIRLFHAAGETRREHEARFCYSRKLVLLDKTADAVPHLRTVLQWAESESDWLLAADAGKWLADAYLELGSAKEARLLAEEAVRHADRAVRDDARTYTHATLAFSLMTQGEVLHELREYAAALASLVKAEYAFQTIGDTRGVQSTLWWQALVCENWAESETREHRWTSADELYAKGVTILSSGADDTRAQTTLDRIRAKWAEMCVERWLQECGSGSDGLEGLDLEQAAERCGAYEERAQALLAQMANREMRAWCARGLAYKLDAAAEVAAKEAEYARAWSLTNAAVSLLDPTLDEKCYFIQLDALVHATSDLLRALMPQDHMWRAWLRAEIDEHERNTRWTESIEQVAWWWRLRCAIGSFLFYAGDGARESEVLADAVDTVLANLHRIEDAHERTEIQAYALYKRAGLLDNHYESEEAEELLKKARRLYEQLQDMYWVAACQDRLGSLCAKSHRFREAWDYFEQAERAYQELKDAEGPPRVIALGHFASRQPCRPS